MINGATILLAILALAGCATTLSPEYQSSLDSWVGAPVVEFFNNHPEPDSMIDMIDYRVYKWSTTNSVTTTDRGTVNCVAGVDLNDGFGATPSCTTGGGSTYTARYQCAWSLRVERNVITAATLIGDACGRATPPKSRPSNVNAI